MSDTFIQVIFNIIGYALILIALKKLYSVIKLEVTGIKTEGKIIDIHKIESVDDVMHLPLIEFQTQTGEMIQVKRSYDNFKTKKIGQELSIIYNPQKPTEMVMNTFFDKYFVVIFLLLLGIPFSIFGLLLS